MMDVVDDDGDEDGDEGDEGKGTDVEIVVVKKEKELADAARVVILDITVRILENYLELRDLPKLADLDR
jgi:hypothetical protein